MFKLLSTLILLVFISLSANATQISAVVDDTLPNGHIAVGQPFTVDIYMHNDWGEQVGLSMPFAFYSPDQSIEHVIHNNVGGYSADSIPFFNTWNDSSILTYNGFDNLWTLLRIFYGTSWEGNLPDTINITVATIYGWNITSQPVHYLSFAYLINETGEFCIDSIDHSDDLYDWLFDDPNVTFNGPHCWTVSAPDSWETEIDPSLFWTYQAYSLDSSRTASVFISGTHDSYTVYDIDTPTVRINDQLIPFNFEVVTEPGGGFAGRLAMEIRLCDLIGYYEPIWDTSEVIYTISYEFDDNSDNSIEGSFVIVGHRSGDVNGDGLVNIMDIVYLIDYLYRGGPAPMPYELAGDINCSRSVDLLDILYLIKYLYYSGPPPKCPY